MDNFFINPARLDAVRHRLIESANAFHLGDQKANTSWDEWADILEKYGTAPRSYKIVNGTAVIPARGALISCDIPYWFYFGDVSYEALAATVEHAVANPEVERVLLRINSPGGTDRQGGGGRQARLGALQHGGQRRLLAGGGHQPHRGRPDRRSRQHRRHHDAC
jgi:hypothetical protein